MTIHAFGAYFGLAVSLCLKKLPISCLNKASSSNMSNLLSFLGTSILWVYWPSFNSYADAGVAKMRAQANTYLALMGSTVATLALSNFMSE